MGSESTYAVLVRDLRELLGLDEPPIGIAFVEEKPEGVETFQGQVPSSCSFWREAERGVFYAPAEAHFNCAVGAMTMGFGIEPFKEKLMTTVQMMCDSGYIGGGEPEKIPTVKSGHRGIVYGPLGDFPIEADLALLWLEPRQAMLLNEASGGADWSKGSPLPVLGRPACSALPLALAQAQAMLSLGCLGMRTYTEIAGDRMLAVLPGAHLEDIVNRLRATVESNQKMAEYYNSSKAAFSGVPA